MVIAIIKQGCVYYGIDQRIDTKTVEVRTYQGVCFASLDEKGNIVGGSMRAASNKSSFRKDFDNNDKSFGFAMPGRSNRVYVFEAAIDAMSHATLMKMQGQDCQRDHRTFEFCLPDRASQRYLPLHPEFDEIVCSFHYYIDGLDSHGKPRHHGQLVV